MNRRPFSFRSLAAVATADSAAVAAAMSYRPHFRGGRSQFGRGYCDRPVSPANGDRPEFVCRESHLGAIRGANRGFRPSYNAVPPPPQYYAAQQMYRPEPRFQRPGPPGVQAEQRPGPRPFRHPLQGGNYQQGPPGVQAEQRPGPRPFRHPPQGGNYQQFRPQQFRKPPDFREWEHRKLELPPHCERFTVLSYNILADYLAIDHWHKLYFHIPNYIMDWNWRKKSIIFELGLWSADILCLQEVDRFEDIEAELKPRGYNGIWKMRTGRPVDGCAIFWRVSRFKMIFEESIEFIRLGLRDNVAQICVFESLNGLNNSSGASSLSTSSGHSNRVVVCNIHVLFNPRRGEIKLGQIRTLLERAYIVSKLWDDAPVVICGDFNCTPESPLYKFIKERELDLSVLARDKVSGQASAELGSPREFRAGGMDNFAQTPAVNSKKVLQGDLSLDAQKLARPDLSTNAPSVTEGMSSPSDPYGVLDQNGSNVQGNIQSPTLSDKGTDEISELESPSKDIHSEASDGGENVESDLQTLSETPDSQIKQNLSANHSEDLSSTYNSGSSELEEPSKNCSDANLSEHVAVAVSDSASTQEDKTSGLSAPCKSTSSDIDGKFEALSLDEVVNDATQEATEDCESFLSDLHSDRDSSSPNQKLHCQGDEILSQNLKQEGNYYMGYSPYNPSAWTPAEIETATGSSERMVVEHPLTLTSAYAEVESSSGLRDSSGEPFVTSYHKRFSGTVDYIWRSQGLETVKVLAPIAKHVMHQTRGFPTKKWGSDHIALVSEFAFTKGISSDTLKQ